MISIEQNTDRRDLEKTRWSRWLAAVAIAMSMMMAGMAGASAETRSLKLYFVHTGEKAEIVFKRNGRYDQAGLKKINNILRDFRRNEPTRMDPRLLDLIWETYRSVGATNYINVVSAYRSPATNSLLRSRSKGVAKKSQHMLGKAMDFFIPGVSLKKLRETGMKMQVGGVGYYPRSGSPFVHMDVGNVRHWPKMSRRELVELFPNGKTLHVPSDGKPLPGFQDALASYQSRKKSGTSALALASGGATKGKPASNLLAAFFGGGADEEEDVAEPAPVVKPAKAVAAPKVVEEAEETVVEQKPAIAIIPPSKAKRTDVELFAQPEVAEPELAEPVAETPESIIAALPLRSIPVPGVAPRPKADVGTSLMATASIPPVSTEPESMPFGMAQEPPAELTAAPMAEMPAPEAPAAESEMVSNVPLPSWRPGEPAATATDSDDDALPMALASADPDPFPASDTINAVPMARPTADDEEFPIASLPDTAPEPLTAHRTTLRADERALVDAEIKAGGERVAALASVSSASPKLAIAGSAPGTDPVSAISPGVKTTRKAARANRNDSKPGRKAVVVAAEPMAARWVLSKDYVSKETEATRAPSFAYNVVVTAPREVYTAGFQKGDQLADANRFTGKAVKFLSVARFQ